VLSRDEGAVRVIALNRPQRLNAITLAMLRDLDAALAAAEDAAGVRAILLCGEGRAFSAGDDLAEQVETSRAGVAALARQLETLQRISERIMFGTKPVVAAVHGWAIGGAFSWTLNCDFTVWAEGARAFLPEAALGLYFTGGASWLLPRRAGHAMARELTFLGRRLEARELQHAGLAGRVVVPDRLFAEALALAHELAALPPASAAQLKRGLIEPERTELVRALALEAEICIARSADPATVTRLEAFVRDKL
jgi:enoyl-CoA hydratase/carnithine racemase